MFWLKLLMRIGKLSFKVSLREDNLLQFFPKKTWIGTNTIPKRNYSLRSAGVLYLKTVISLQRLVKLGNQKSKFRKAHVQLLPMMIKWMIRITTFSWRINSIMPNTLWHCFDPIVFLPMVKNWDKIAGANLVSGRRNITGIYHRISPNVGSKNYAAPIDSQMTLR